MKKRLAELGLASNEIDAYLYLLKTGSGKPTIIARDIGILRSNIYGVLDRLREYGLIEEVEGFKSKVYTAGEIEESLAMLLAREREKVQKKVQIASELTSLLADVKAGRRNSKPAEIITDAAHSASAIKHLFDNVKDEILSIVHPPYMSSRFHMKSESDADNNDEIEGYLTEEPMITGYKMYTIFQISDISLASFKLLLKGTLPNSAKIAVAFNTPTKLLIVDRKYIAVGLTSPETGLPVKETVVLHNPGMAELLAQSFFTLFNSLHKVTSLDEAEEIYQKVHETADDVVDHRNKKNGSK